MSNKDTNIFAPIAQFFSAPFRISALTNEKDNLRAILASCGGEYCLIDDSGIASPSDGFCALLGLDEIKAADDIANSLGTPDAQRYLQAFKALNDGGADFSLQVTSCHDARRHFQISASRACGRVIVWVRDHSALVEKYIQTENERNLIDGQFRKLKAALNTLPRPVWIRDSQQDMIWVNDTYCDYLGKERNEILRDQIHITAGAAKRKDSDASDDARKAARLALETGEMQEKNAHGIFHGKRLLLRLSAIAMPDMNMTLGFAYDITQEEELETELKRYETSTNELMGQLRSAIGIFDAAQQLIFYNSAYSQLWGLEAGWLDTKPKLGDVMEKLRENRKLPEQADFRSFKQSWLDMFTNLIKPDEDMLYLPDGSALRMLVVPHSMGGLMMTFEDVTSRLALESSYNTLVAVQRETLDNLAEGVSVFGGDGRIKLWNPSYARQWHLQPEDLEGEPHINALLKKKKALFNEDSWKDAQRSILARVLNNDLSLHRLTLNGKDSHEALLDMSAVSLPDGGVLVTYTDMTNAARVENALREKAQALEAAEHLKLDFLANVSYQLRTPLSSIMGFTDILRNEYFGPLNDRQKDYTSDIQVASEKLLHQINNILDLSTLEAGFMTLERASFDVRSMLNHVYELVNEWARKEDITVTLDCPDNLGDLNGDERRLQQALINLVRNAITFTPAGGMITLKAQQDKSTLHFTVKDTGTGIAAEDKARIFEPFERARGLGLGAAETDENKPHRLRRTSGGAGLGLSLVRRIAEAHGGRVELESEPDKGTKICVIIPLTSVKTTFKIPEPID